VELVNLRAGEQQSAEYARLSPLGKVPALEVDEHIVTENAAILTFIAALAPAAGLFPSDDSPLALARRQAGLSFCGGTLHPIVRGLANPSRITDGDGEPVRERSRALATKSYGYAERHLAANTWWLGVWSIIDVYLDWSISVAKVGGFSFVEFPLLDGLHAKLLERPAFAATMGKEAEFGATLAARAK
jgi:glutathione S-transferase